MPTPFKARKNAEELKVDTSREFVVVKRGGLFSLGEILVLEEDNNTPTPVFKSTKTGETRYCSWYRLAYADDVAKPVREEECLLGYDVGKEGGDETVALYGKRHEDGYVEVTKRVEGLWVGPTENSKPYVPKVGDRVVLEGEVVEIEEGGRLNVKLQPSAGEIYLYPIDVANGVLKLLSRAPSTLTKAEAEALLTEKLGESVRIE